MAWRPVARRQIPALQASTVIPPRLSTAQVVVGGARAFHHGGISHQSQSPSPASIPLEEELKNNVKSAHDWAAIISNYGKSEAATAEAAAAAALILPRIHAKTRKPDEAGSRYSRRIRKTGLIPGILYGVGAQGARDKVLITVERVVVERLLRRYEDSFGSTVYELVVDNRVPERVIATGLDRDPGNAMPTAVNFLRYKPGHPVKVPVCFINEELCLPMKRGGYMLSLNRFVKVCCYGDTVPEMLFADLTGLDAGQKVTLKNLALPPGVRVDQSVPKDFALGVIQGKSTKEAGGDGEGGEEEEEEEEEKKPAAAPAAGKAPAAKKEEKKDEKKEDKKVDKKKE